MLKLLGFILLFMCYLLLINGLTDYTLSCQRGYKISAIRRSNSIFQNGRAGSLSIECQSIVETDLDSVSSIWIFFWFIRNPIYF